jgi:surface protein
MKQKSKLGILLVLASLLVFGIFNASTVEAASSYANVTVKYSYYNSKGKKIIKKKATYKVRKGKYFSLSYKKMPKVTGNSRKSLSKFKVTKSVTKTIAYKRNTYTAVVKGRYYTSKGTVAYQTVKRTLGYGTYWNCGELPDKTGHSTKSPNPGGIYVTKNSTRTYKYTPLNYSIAITYKYGSKSGKYSLGKHHYGEIIPATSSTAFPIKAGYNAHSVQRFVVTSTTRVPTMTYTTEKTSNTATEGYLRFASKKTTTQIKKYVKADNVIITVGDSGKSFRIKAGALNDLDFRDTDLKSFTGRWDTRKITDMSMMFYECDSLAIFKPSKFETSRVRDMSGMFCYCRSLSQLDLSSWNTGNVENMSEIFTNCSGLTDLDVASWNTGNVKSMSGMFTNCSGLTDIDIASWNTRKLEIMSYMFEGCLKLTNLNLAKWDTSHVVYMEGLFWSCLNLNISSLSLSKWDTSQVIDMRNMFANCRSITSLDLSNFDISNVHFMSEMFKNCSSLSKLNVTGWNVEKVSWGGMFTGCSKLESSRIIDKEYTEQVPNIWTIYFYSFWELNYHNR